MLALQGFVQAQGDGFVLNGLPFRFLAPHHGSLWIADHIRLARALGKPLVVGEFGMSQNTAAIFDAWLQTWHAENGADALAWQVMCGVCYDMRDQFGIPYPPASAATNVLAQHAAAANAGGGAVFTVGATTATPAVAAPDQTVTVQTSVTAAVAASDPQGRKVGQQIFSGQSFAAGQTRTYGWTWPVGANRRPGTYTIKAGVFNGSWSTMYLWVNAASSFGAR